MNDVFHDINYECGYRAFKMIFVQKIPWLFIFDLILSQEIWGFKT